MIADSAAGHTEALGDLSGVLVEAEEGKLAAVSQAP